MFTSKLRLSRKRRIFWLERPRAEEILMRRKVYSIPPK